MMSDTRQLRLHLMLSPTESLSGHRVFDNAWSGANDVDGDTEELVIPYHLWAELGSPAAVSLTITPAGDQ